MSDSMFKKKKLLRAKNIQLFGLNEFEIKQTDAIKKKITVAEAVILKYKRAALFLRSISSFEGGAEYISTLILFSMLFTFFIVEI